MKGKTLRTLILSLLAAAGAAAPLSAAEITARPIPAEAFARVPDIGSVSMSDEGDLIVAIIAAPGSDNQRTALATWDLTRDAESPVLAPNYITPSGNRMEFVAASALKAGRVLAIGRQEFTGRLGGCGEGSIEGATATFMTKAYLTDLTHERFEDAFARNTRAVGISPELQRCFELAGTAGLISTLPLDPDHVLVQQLNTSTLASNVYRYNVRTGATELFYRSGGRSSPAFFSPRDGEVLVQSRTETAGNGDFEILTELKNPSTGAWEVHDALTVRATERFNVSITGMDEATGQFYVTTDKFSDLAAVYLYDPATRQFSDEPVAAHPEFSMSGVVLSTRPSNFNQPIAVTYLGAGPGRIWLDENLQSVQDGLEQVFPDTGVSIIDWTDDFSTILFSTGASNRPASFYVMRDLSRVQLLGHSRPWLHEYPMERTTLDYYEARDGLRIPALLTLPAGWTRDAGPLPTIVLPHGGPWARDFATWDSSGWPQFLASRGYAVMQPQYRGSTGFGRQLWLAGDAEWGQAMQDDKDDGAAWLVAEGIADPDRIAIFGYSYGGFAAAAAVVRPGGPFQCAISGAPVTELTRLGNTWSENQLQRAFQGRTVAGMDPIQNTNQADIPVLLYVGDRDVRTPAFHARNFYNRVRDRVPAQLHMIRNMPHSLPWYYDHHIETLNLIETFLANDCGPGGL